MPTAAPEFKQNTLIVVVGPTAVGKTDFCVRLAQWLDTEIVSADSRQFFKELNIGTAKPTSEEMQGVVHHFVGSHNIEKLYSVGDFERDALKCLDEIFSRKKVAILTGGSGLYIKAVLEGFDEMPEIDLDLRETLNQRAKDEGITLMLEELKILDPEFFISSDINNTQRIVRALEVCLLTGKPFSSFKQKQIKPRYFEVIKIGLERPREALYDRINQRMDIMLQNGLLQEVKSLLAFREHNALKTVGYREVFDYFDAKYDETEMIRLLKQNSRRYAKRQLTWFKNQDNYTWFDANDLEGVKQLITN